jgi:predicted SAM-dependent methyltransferase
MKINIGGGFKKFEGFLNVDLDASTNPDIVMNLETDKFPLEDSSVDEVKAHHIFEHIGEGFLDFMKELYRICKDGAIIDIEVPHHRHENFFGDPTHRRPITIEMLRKFSKKYNEWHIEHHKSSSGFGLFCDVDFEILEYDFVVDQDYAELAAQGKYEQLHQMSKQINNVYSDLRIKLVVVKP